MLADVGSLNSSNSGPGLDNIWMECHPSSTCVAHVESFDEYTTHNSTHPLVLNQKPWLPFHLQAEFAFVEIALETAMLNKQGDVLINIVHTLLKGEEAFKLTSHCDLQGLWDKESERLTPVGIHLLSLMEYKFFCSLSRTIY
jgi:hypothetical protein